MFPIVPGAVVATGLETVVEGLEFNKSTWRDIPRLTYNSWTQAYEGDAENAVKRRPYDGMHWSIAPDSADSNVVYVTATGTTGQVVYDRVRFSRQ
jgi:hypothetical protein